MVRVFAQTVGRFAHSHRHTLTCNTPVNETNFLLFSPSDHWTFFEYVIALFVVSPLSDEFFLF